MQRKIAYIWRVLICGLLLAGCGREMITIESESTATDVEITAEIVTSEEELYVTSEVPVYVCGAVNQPGVYYLSVGSIKEEAIRLAGGFREDAAAYYVNLAQDISEGERIYVPTEAELESGTNLSLEDFSLDGEKNSTSDSGKVNINTATKEKLMTIPGIGEGKADAIIKYRETQGAFGRPEDIMNIAGIKEGVYDKIKEFIVVN